MKVGVPSTTCSSEGGRSRQQERGAYDCQNMLLNHTRVCLLEVNHDRILIACRQAAVWCAVCYAHMSGQGLQCVDSSLNRDRSEFTLLPKDHGREFLTVALRSEFASIGWPGTWAEQPKAVVRSRSVHLNCVQLKQGATTTAC